jgi:hypothetical protein
MVRLVGAVSGEVCPLCRGLNDCAVQRGELVERCWCRDVVVPVAPRERVPSGTACICERCMEAARTSPTA